MLSWLRHLTAHALRRDLSLPRQAAHTMVYLATAPDLDRLSGSHFCKTCPTRPSPAARDPEAARQLWTLSLQLTGLNGEQGSQPFVHDVVRSPNSGP
jgi:hypothetical protein